MITKIFFLCSCLVCLSVAGEGNLTGNAFWDLQMATNDSLIGDQPTVMNQPQETKSPMLNGLFSLVIPGAGQYNTERYTKAAIFIGVEAALIAYAVINDRNGDKKTGEFQRYADAHWSAVRYAQWINTHGSADYGPAVTIDLVKVENRDYSEINEWESAQAPNKVGFSHHLPPYGDQQYFELIGKYHQYKFGWDEYDDADGDGVPDSDNRNYYDLKGADRQFNWYAAERGKANDYYYAAGFAVSALFVNHIVSAIDALISTRAYNKEITATVGMRPVDSYNGKSVMSELRISIGF